MTLYCCTQCIHNISDQGYTTISTTFQVKRSAINVLVQFLYVMSTNLLLTSLNVSISMIIVEMLHKLSLQRLLKCTKSMYCFFCYITNLVRRKLEESCLRLRRFVFVQLCFIVPLVRALYDLLLLL